MIDHDYKIVTREVSKASRRLRYFSAALSQVFIILDGKRVAISYPYQEFFGKTQSVAIILASDAFRHWLIQTYPSN